MPIETVELVANVLDYFDTKVVEKDGTTYPMFDGMTNYEKATEVVVALRLHHRLSGMTLADE